MLEICLTDDAGAAVGAAAVVAGWKAIKAQHLRPAVCKVEQRGAADAAGAQYDDIVGWQHSGQ